MRGTAPVNATKIEKFLDTRKADAHKIKEKKETNIATEHKNPQPTTKDSHKKKIMISPHYITSLY